MSGVRRQYLFFVALFAYSLSLVSLPSPLCSQDIQPPSPPLYGSEHSGGQQEDDMARFFSQFNGCAWYKTPNDPYRDVYLELRNGALTVYEYLKSELYCSFTLRNCFVQEELWRMKVAGYDTVLPDRPGNVYRIVLDKNGETITLHGVDNAGRDYVMGIFVRYFCSAIR
mgnify:CR=1 FL=1